MINYYHPQNKTKGYQMKTILTFNKHGGIRRSPQYNYRGKLIQNSYKYRGVKQIIKPNLYGPNLYLLLTN